MQIAHPAVHWSSKNTDVLSVKLHISKFRVNNWHDVSEGRATFNGSLMKKAPFVPFMSESCSIWWTGIKKLIQKLVGDETDRVYKYWLLVSLCSLTARCKND